MKSMGIVRPVDMFGRIVLPEELRSTLNTTEEDPLETFAEDSVIILKKYQPSCIFCGSVDRVSKYKDHSVCHKCMGRLTKRPEEESD